MSIIAGMLLFLALIVPGGYWPRVSYGNIFAVVWFIVFVCEKAGYLKLP